MASHASGQRETRPTLRTQFTSPNQRFFAYATQTYLDICYFNKQREVWHETRVCTTDFIRTTSEAEQEKEKCQEETACMALYQQM